MDPLRLRLPPALLLLAALSPAAPAPASPMASVVKFKTADGMTLEADWYAGDEGMPGVVGLHQYPSDRTSWKPLAEKRPAGWHFLAVDLRGYGGSKTQDGKDLSDRVKKRDPELFKAMWQDALAAVKHLRDEAKCDPKRIGLVGASVGCSIAMDATVRRGQDVAAVCCLTPGTDYLGVPTMDHLKTWKEQPLLLLSAEDEAEGGAKPIAAALSRKPEVELRIVPGEKIHGTNMFGKAAGIEDRITAWLEAVLGRQILDGVIDPVEAKVPEGRGDEQTFQGGLEKSLRIRVDAKGINIVGEGTFSPAFLLFVDPTGSTEEFPPGGKRLRGSGSPSGSLVGAAVDTWNDGSWAEQPVGARPGMALVNEQVLEFRIPWKVFAIEPGGKKVRIGFKPISRRYDWKAGPATWADALGRVAEVPQCEETRK
jgi:pimeloyl-ACP methyl ester carboxylesterase